MGEAAKLFKSSREPGAKYDLYYPSEGVQDVQADGYAQIWLGRATSRFGVYCLKGFKAEDAETIEERTVFMRISMPTSHLAELCKAVLDSMSQNEDALLQGYQDEAQRIKQVLDSYKKESQHDDER